MEIPANGQNLQSAPLNELKHNYQKIVDYRNTLLSPMVKVRGYSGIQSELPNSKDSEDSNFKVSSLSFFA